MTNKILNIVAGSIIRTTEILVLISIGLLLVILSPYLLIAWANDRVGKK